MANLPGAKTFTDIVNEVGEYLFTNTAPSSSTYPTLSRIQTIVNDKYREICSKKNWWFLFDNTTFNTVANTYTYAMSDSAVKVMYMSIPANFLRLTFAPRAQFMASYPAGNAQVSPAIPLSYIPAQAAANNALQYDLFPTPSQVYTVLYWYEKRVGNLSGTNVPVIPPEWQDVLVHSACYEAFAMISVEDNRTQYHKMRADARYREMWLADEQNLDWQEVLRNFDAEGTPYSWPGLVRPYLS